MERLAQLSAGGTWKAALAAFTQAIGRKLWKRASNCWRHGAPVLRLETENAA